ncbi:MAG TPA: transposase [Saprospiraceae bacterium]|nr:transposase [Saprospiraceae bacterium]HNG89018.1 transposase [Saprospiraceae bacterium]
MKNYELPLEPGATYHVFNHANGFENLFVNEGNYRYFLRKYAEHIPPVADTLAYCLMPNHIHLMIRIKSVAELPENCGSNKISKHFGNLFSAYAQAFNKQQRRRGSLFIPNFKRSMVTTEAYFARLVHYIHRNPVKDGFVSHPAEWPHSSFMSLLSDKPSRLLRKEVMEFFGGREGFLAAHNLDVDDKFLKIVSQWY